MGEEFYRGKDGILNVRKSLCHVDSKSAEAWSKTDEERVKELIAETIGFKMVDAGVRAFMINWVAGQMKECLTELIHDEEDSPHDAPADEETLFPTESL